MNRRLFCGSAMMIIFSLVFFKAGTGQEREEHQPIVESVEINWWQVPIFAVDGDGNPITDLQETDIEVWLNNRRVETFSFYKRTFTATQPKEAAQEKPLEKEKEIPRPPTPLKKNILFLLFDVSMSGISCTQRSKDIAQQMIARAEPGTPFVILTIEPFKGLTYIFGPSEDKKALAENLEKKVMGKPNERLVDYKKFFYFPQEGERRGGGTQQEIGEKEKRGLDVQVSAYYRKKAESLLESFETLYLIFNTLRDNKFVYFFTQGISNAIAETAWGERTRYNSRLEKAANLLGRCGAVLFIVNPLGVHDAGELITEFRDANDPDVAGTATSALDKEKSLSGEDWLRYMAKESGGKYLEGVDKEIVGTLEQMHRAYYEISFPDLPGLEGAARDIAVKPKRKGVLIHSLRSLEKNKPYAEMNPMEKEILVINLVAQNPLLKTILSVQPARVTEIKKTKNRVVYTLILPGEFLNRHLEVYKCWVKDDREIIHLETGSLEPKKPKIQVEFEIKKDQAPDLKPYFALVDGKAGIASIRAIGDEWVEPEEIPSRESKFKKEPISAAEFQNLLSQAADYCEKLKTSAFHFFCREKIVEVRNSLFSKKYLDRDIQEEEQVKRSFYPPRRRDNLDNLVNTYIFTYRLIKNGTQIKEERELVSSPDNVPVTRDQVIKPTAFFSERVIFAPYTLLARERQGMYNIRFLGYDTYKNLRAAVIEVLPRNPGNGGSLYGKVWIDTRDYTVLKMEADPRSINGYSALKDIEIKIRTRLFLTMEIEFNEIHGGIRYPTHIQVVEKYKGGRYVTMYSGTRGWERNRTTFTYSDYRFFDVNVEVTIK